MIKKNRILEDDKVIVALIMATDGSDKIGTNPDLSPIFTQDFLDRVNAKAIQLKGLIQPTIDEMIGVEWIIHFAEFIHDPETYDVLIYCNKEEYFFRISDIIKNRLKGIKFHTIVPAGPIPQTERQ